MQPSLAKELFRGHCIGLEAHRKWFGEIAEEDARALQVIPCHAEHLLPLVGYGTLIAFVPRSVSALRHRFPRFFEHGRTALPSVMEAAVVGAPGWHFVFHEGKHPGDSTSGLTWAEQQRLFTARVGVPSVQLMVAAMLGQFLLTRETPFAGDNATLRTATDVGEGRRATAGYALDGDRQPVLRVGVIADAVASSRLFAATAFTA